MEWSDPVAPAAQDPAWERATVVVGSMPTLRTIFFVGRALDIFVFVRDMIELHAARKEAIVGDRMRGVPALLREPGLLKTKSPEESESAIRFMLRHLEEEFQRKVNSYQSWLINQGLVMCCTVLDAFLEELVEVLYRQRKELLYASAEAKTIHLKKIVELGTVEALLKYFRDKEVTAFGFAEIEKRFEYLYRRLHIDTGRVFDWGLFSAEVAKQLAGWDLERLKKLYESRHGIVHRGELPLGTLDEFQQTEEFLQKIMWNLTAIVIEKHGVMADFNAMLLRAELYERFKAEAGGGESP